MYFRKNKRFEVESWYFALRGFINVVLGASFYLRTDWASNLAMQIFGVWLIFNNVLQMTPSIFRQRTRRLLPEVLSTGIIGITVGILALIKTFWAIEIATIFMGFLLLFRSIIELKILVESRIRVHHQRRLLAWTMITLIFSFYFILNPFQEIHFLVKAFGVYSILIGLNHILISSRLSEKIEQLEEETRKEESGAKNLTVENYKNVAWQKNQLYEKQWNPIKPGEIIEPSKYSRPIVIAAHPDDLEAFAGGLAFRLDGVFSIIFSGGDKGVWESKYKDMSKPEYINMRLGEAVKAGKLLGLKQIIYMGYTDRNIDVNPENIEKIMVLLNHYNPDLVISFEYHHKMTLDPHPDHLAVGEITRQAIKKFSDKEKLDYILMSSILPDIFVDISDVRRVKLEALSKHETQLSFNSIIFPFLEKLITKIWGAYLNIDYAEGYRIVELRELEND